MRFENDQIATALRLYYEGLSLDTIKDEFQHQFNKNVATSTLYEWIQEFTNEAITRANKFKPKIGDEWIADETAITVRGKEHTGKKYDSYYWCLDIIDSRSRFLLATRISPTRSIADVEIVMKEAAQRAGKVPSRILTDKMRGYPEGIKIAFNGQVRHIQTSPFVEVDSTNILERFQGTLKDRVKVLRGFKSVDTAKQVLDGWLVYYNFMRPHESLDGESPAGHMHVEMPFNSWLDIIKNTQTRVSKPEVQPTVIPMMHTFETNPELRRQYDRDWYRKHKHNPPVYKPRKPKKSTQPKQPKSNVQSMIISPRRPKQ
ncbi:MAG: DDE-type integrase/transposase/recombinase [Dehalococcoidia bacterium]|jgi:transposase-like protein